MWTANEVAIGTMDLKYGIIMLDLDFNQDARICFEKDTPNAPLSITLGIYTLLFHTIFCEDENEALQKISLLTELTPKAVDALKLDRRDDLDRVVDAIIHLNE